MVIRLADDELFDGVEKVVNHFVVAALQLAAIGDGRQEVVQDGDEEVHDHDDHRKQVDDEEQSGELSAE